MPTLKTYINLLRMKDDFYGFSKKNLSKNFQVMTWLIVISMVCFSMVVLKPKVKNRGKNHWLTLIARFSSRSQPLKSISIHLTKTKLALELPILPSKKLGNKMHSHNVLSVSKTTPHMVIETSRDQMEVVQHLNGSERDHKMDNNNIWINCTWVQKLTIIQMIRITFQFRVLFKMPIIIVVQVQVLTRQATKTSCTILLKVEPEFLISDRQHHPIWTIRWIWLKMISCFMEENIIKVCNIRIL